MKKSLFLVALATMSLASCSNDEVMDVQQDVISFEAVADNGSRALDIYASDNTPDMFKVYAVLTKGTEKTMYIDGAIVKKTTEGYKFEDGARSWPVEGSLTFYAVVEPEEAGLEYNEGDETGYYTYNSENTKLNYNKLSFDDDFNASLWIQQNSLAPKYHHDLIYAVKANQTKAANGKTPVVLNFRHAFSQVVLKAKNLSPATSHVELGQVIFMNIKRYGDFTLPNTSTDASTNNKGVWSNLSPNYKAKPSETGNGYWWNYGGSENVVVNSATAMDLMTSSSTEIMAYPQANTALDVENVETSTGTFLRVYFDEYNIAGSSYNEATDVEVSAYDYIDVPLAINWEAGKKYTYTLIFGDGGIKFDLSVEDYIEDTDTPVYPN